MSLKVDLDKELEKRFRQLAMKRFGYSKGAIKKAAETAIKNWAGEEKLKDSRKMRGNPVDLIVGGLAHLKGKKTSVELQHEAKKIWVKSAEDK